MVTPVEPPPEPPGTLTDPRELLAGYLDFYRDALLRKLDGMSEAALRDGPLPSGWTPLELFKHLTYVEIRWLQWGFAAEEVPEPWGDRGPDDRWHVGAEETLDDLKAAFLRTCERSRRIVAEAPLDGFAAPGGRFGDAGETPSLIWILFHLLQEYARHLGHLDVVRELSDGQVGE
ncbi:DinB family protein [Actinomadura graeca]|uniref:DinB family protein n=1 Tax=Actinomadura graeca TaxID=2750812 RepID=A0ABX8QNC5_9ACTN|nr:DinB family protein [Actinomadura graeca]QXJ20275.1 DinB family protein [Actinomadura graeca]